MTSFKQWAVALMAVWMPVAVQALPICIVDEPLTPGDFCEQGIC
jgi:hypothetical protein